MAGLAVAVLMAIASGSFIVALNHASVANVLFMQALAPILAAVLGMLARRARQPPDVARDGVAIGGVALMVGGPGRPARSASGSRSS